MYKNILVPIVFDHNPSEIEALAVAHDLIDEDGKITLLHVVEEIPGYVSVQISNNILEGVVTDAISKLKSIAEQSPFPVGIAVEKGHSSRTILSYATNSNADCIVISSHKPGLKDYILGSTASHIVGHASCAIHVLR